MTRIIHTGDTHLGYRQYHSPERREDFLEAFAQVVEDAVAEDVDAVVHAGDLFHDRRPGLMDLQGTVEVLDRLRAADVPFLAVVGNHEGKRDAQWLDLFEDLGLATRLDESPYRLGDLAVYGLDFVPRSRRDQLDYEFESTDADHRVLVSHGLFEPFPHADWDTERLLSESTVEFDALLVGDDHKPAREELDGTLLTYCGSTERASASEREQRGYNIVTVEDGTLSVSRRGLDATREFVFVDVELAEGEGGDRVREAVREHDLEDAVVIVTVEGAGDPVTPATIEELATERGALVARVNDRREIESAEDGPEEVSFADPDEAVRDRLSEMDIGGAARDIDETVRFSKLADSNVREAVERQVRDSLDDLDAGPDGPSPDADDPSDLEDRPGDAESDDPDDEATRDGDSTGEDPADEESAGEEPTAGATADGDGDSEGQASMEEYL
jgi:DNA repair exonuclease SbcCD nuclease subunit